MGSPLADRALVVGASSEIGARISQVFAERQWRLSLWGRNAERLEACARDAQRAGASAAQVRRVDVTDPAALREAAAAEADTDRLRAVVWAAGTFQWGSFETVDAEQTRDVFATNLVAAASASQLLAPALIRSAPSNLIYVGSGAGRQAYQSNAAYVAAKHGLRGLAEALQLDLGERGVTVTTITAGLVNAGAGRLAPAALQHPDEILQPADIARAVRFVIDFPANACPTEIVLRPRTAGG